MTRTPVAVLASGTGSNLRALIDDSRATDCPYRIVVVGSDRPKAGALAIATDANIPTVVVPGRAHPDRESFDRAMLTALAPYAPAWLCFAGYMRLVTPTFLAAYPNRILNIHPSLLPAFPGLHAQRQAFEAGVEITGCTVHLVSEEVDAGPILGQSTVPVLATDDAESLRLRILAAEHELFARVLRNATEGRVGG